MATYKKDINLFAAMAHKKSRVSPLVIVVPTVVFLILGALIALSLVWYSSTMALLTTERDTLQLYIESSRVEDSQADAQALKAEADEMQARANEIKGTLLSLSSYPDLYGEHFRTIFDFAGYDVELSEYVYDRRTGTLSFAATSPGVRRMPYFIQSLRGCGYFSDIQYRGYVRGTHSESGEPVIDELTDITTIPTFEVIEYRYEITCKLVAPVPSLPAVETDGGTNVQEGGGE